MKNVLKAIAIVPTVVFFSCGGGAGGSGSMDVSGSWLLDVAEVSNDCVDQFDDTIEVVQDGTDISLDSSPGFNDAQGTIDADGNVELTTAAGGECSGTFTESGGEFGNGQAELTCDLGALVCDVVYDRSNL